jgi:tetratricopeptide (TPR) repeat protein
VLSRRTIAPALLVAVTLAARSAAAQDSDIERARALFDEAGELERQGQWTAAQEKLRAAIKIRETPHLRYALGWALENDDKLLEAKAEYETAARLASQKAGAEEVGRLANARLAEVEKKTPLVQVRVPGGSASGTRVVVDGRATTIKDDMVVMPVNPGSRVIRIERAGQPPSEQLVYVPRGMVRVVDLPKAENVASRTASHDRHDAAADTTTHLVVKEERSNTLPIVLVASGAALVLGGGVLFASSSSDANERDERMAQWCNATACSGGTTATLPESADATAHRQAATEAAERGNTKQAIGLAASGVGLVGVAVGSYFLLRGQERPASPTARKLTPTAGMIPGGAMAGASFTF